MLFQFYRCKVFSAASNCNESHANASNWTKPIDAKKFLVVFYLLGELAMTPDDLEYDSKDKALKTEINNVECLNLNLGCLKLNL